MFCHVTLKLGGQKDFRFDCHALIPVNFGLQKLTVLAHIHAKFCFRCENCASTSISTDFLSINIPVSMVFKSIIYRYQLFTDIGNHAHV